MVDVEFIRKKHFLEGWSVRQIGRQLNLARQTVRKALVSAEPPQYRPNKPRACPVMDPWRGVIEAWLAQDRTAPAKQRNTAQRIYTRLVQEHQFMGAESTVRRFVRLLRNHQPEVYIPLSAGFGQQAQVDWGQATVEVAGRPTVVHLFCLRLRASGVAFVWAAPTEKLEAFLEGHRRAFEWLGGVPAECVYDNPKTAVVRILAGPLREEHTVFSSLRAHYLFDSVFCRPGEGHEKGAVENLVGYVRRNALVPVPAVASWDELTAHLLSWCDAERRQRDADWRREGAGLRPLPAYPFGCALSRLVAVSPLSLVRLDHVRYSVPCRYVGRTVRLALSTTQVELFAGAERVAVHPRCYTRGESVLALEHYLPALERKPRAARNAAVIDQMAPIYATVRERLCRADPQGYRAFVALLLLRREFPADAVAAALAEALARECLEAGVVRQILLNHTAPTPPPPIAVPAALAHVVLAPPDLSRYDTLLAGVGR